MKQLHEIEIGDPLYDGAKKIGHLAERSGHVCRLMLNGRSYKFPTATPMPWASTPQARREAGPEHPSTVATQPMEVPAK